MSSEVKMEVLRAVVTECLSAAAEEILRLVHKALVSEEQPCTTWEMDQQLDTESTESEPLAPESNVEDIKEFWQIPIEDPLSAPDTAHYKDDEKRGSPLLHTSIDTAHTDSRAGWNDELSSPRAVDYEAAQPLCLFRVQPNFPEHSTSVHKMSKGIHGSKALPKKRLKNVSQSKTAKEQKPFKCPCCPRAFSLTKTLLRHMKVHAESYQCAMCGKCFCQKSHLESHTRVHTGEKPFNCHICSDTFSHKRSMINHMKKCHQVA